jgi:hypothetical protein
MGYFRLGDRPRPLGTLWGASCQELFARFPALRNPRTGRPIAIGLSKGSAIIEGTLAWYVDA